MNRLIDGLLLLIGRVLIAALFLPSGIHKLGAFDRTVAAIAAHGLPLPAVGYVVALLAEIPLALALLVGLWTRPVAAALALYTLAAAIFFHNHLADPAQAVNFFKNLAVAGGLFFIVAHGAGAWSVDRLIKRRA
ncbi:MAG TPA: DoxX family protein [Stellaceae bacterium]